MVEARAVAMEYEGEEKEAIVAQLDMAERTLDEIDPLRQPQLLAPVVNEPKNDDLKPLLGRWSPKVPDSWSRTPNSRSWIRSASWLIRIR